MRKFTVTIYANSEYSVRERLQEIDHSISNIVWPSCNIDSSKTRTKKITGRIDEEKQHLLTDYEYEKYGRETRVQKVEECVPYEDWDSDTDQHFENYEDPEWTTDSSRWKNEDEKSSSNINDNVKEKDEIPF